MIVSSRPLTRATGEGFLRAGLLGPLVRRKKVEVFQDAAKPGSSHRGKEQQQEPQDKPPAPAGANGGMDFRSRRQWLGGRPWFDLAADLRRFGGGHRMAPELKSAPLGYLCRDIYFKAIGMPGRLRPARNRIKSSELGKTLFG